MTEKAVVWTRRNGPKKLADLLLGATGVTVLNGTLSLAKGGEAPYVTSGLPAQLQPLIPPRSPFNLQRRIAQFHMARDGVEIRGMPALKQDWLTLLCCGRNGIGHLDIFDSDAHAERYYARQRTQVADFSVLPDLHHCMVGKQSDADLERLAEMLGVTSGIPGAQPKVLLDEWLVKLDNPTYPGLLALEAIAYDYHRRGGFVTPETILLDFDGTRYLASRRFDRVESLPVPVESLFALWNTESPSSIRCNTDGSMEMAAETIQRFESRVPQRKEWFGRVVMSFLTGNGDLHTENISLIGDDQTELSPMYDPAPMRAFRGRENHNLLSALPFAGVGGVASSAYRPFADSGDTPPDLGVRLVWLGRHSGLKEEEAREEICRLLDLTADFASDAAACLTSTIPVNYRGRQPDIPGFISTLEIVRSTILRSLLSDSGVASQR